MKSRSTLKSGKAAYERRWETLHQRPKGIKDFTRLRLPPDGWWARGMKNFRQQAFAHNGEIYLRVSGRQLGDDGPYVPSKFDAPFARRRATTQWFRLIQDETSNAR